MHSTLFLSFDKEINMFEKVKAFVVVNKKPVIETASAVVGTLIGLFIGMVINRANLESSNDDFEMYSSAEDDEDMPE